jgi:hypothetical protein
MDPQRGIGKYPELAKRLLIYTERALEQLDGDERLLRHLSETLTQTGKIDADSICKAPYPVGQRFGAKVYTWDKGRNPDSPEHFGIFLEGELQDFLEAENKFSEPGQASEIAFTMCGVSCEPGTFSRVTPRELTAINKSVASVQASGGKARVTVNETLITVRDKRSGESTTIIRKLIDLARWQLGLKK